MWGTLENDAEDSCRDSKTDWKSQDLGKEKKKIPGIAFSSYAFLRYGSLGLKSIILPNLGMMWILAFRQINDYYNSDQKNNFFLVV